MFRAPVTLSASTQYHFVLYSDTTISASNYYQFWSDSGAGYSNGAAKYYNGAWGAADYNDLRFNVYVTRNDNAVSPPSGYDTGYAQIGWVYNNAGSDFVKFQQINRMVYFDYAGTGYVTTTLTSTTPTFYDLSSFLPPVPVNSYWYTYSASGASHYIIGDLNVHSISSGGLVYTMPAAFGISPLGPVPIDINGVYFYVSGNTGQFTPTRYEW